MRVQAIWWNVYGYYCDVVWAIQACNANRNCGMDCYELVGYLRQNSQAGSAGALRVVPVGKKSNCIVLEGPCWCSSSSFLAAPRLLVAFRALGDWARCNCSKIRECSIGRVAGFLVVPALKCCCLRLCLRLFDCDVFHHSMTLECWDNRWDMTDH